MHLINAEQGLAAPTPFAPRTDGAAETEMPAEAASEGTREPARTGTPDQPTPAESTRPD